MKRKHFALTSSLVQAAAHATYARRGERYKSPTASTDDLTNDPDEPYRDSGDPAFDAAVRSLGPIWRYGPVTPGYTELYGLGPRSGENFIGMPDPERFNTPEDYRRTTAHELVHWTQHKDRLDRDADGMSPLNVLFGIPPRGYGLEEATAELGSALLVDALGTKPDVPWSANYVAGWLRGAEDKDEQLREAGRRAEEAVNWLLERMTAGSV